MRRAAVKARGGPQQRGSLGVRFGSVDTRVRSLTSAQTRSGVSSSGTFLQWPIRRAVAAVAQASTGTLAQGSVPSAAMSWRKVKSFLK